MRKADDLKLRRSLCWRVAVVVAAVGATAATFAQEPTPDTGGGPTVVHSDDEAVAIDFPEELPLEALADFVSRRLEVRLLYGDELRNQAVTLRPGRIVIPRDQLLTFLRSVLRTRGFVLVDEELSDLYRIVMEKDAQKYGASIQTGPPRPVESPARLITQVIEVQSGDTKTLAARISPFTSLGRTALQEVPEQGLLILTDYEDVVARVLALIELIDQPPPHVKTEVFPVSHSRPADLVTQLEEILEQERAFSSQPETKTLLNPNIIQGAIVATGSEVGVRRAAELISQFDAESIAQRRLEIYEPMYITAMRLESLIKQVVLRGNREAAHIHLDRDFNRLYVDASSDVHRSIADLLRAEDKARPVQQRRVRVYRPKNRPADELIETLAQLLKDATLFTDDAAQSGVLPTVDERGADRADSASVALVRPMPPRPTAPAGTGTVQDPGTRGLRGPDYVLTEDRATNAILAIGAPDFHERLKLLIDELDKRPSQVLIETTLVAVTLSDSMNLGFELETLDLGEGWDYLLFSSFGLSSIDVSTGQRVLAPGVGGNGIIIGPEEIPVVFRALATHADSRVMSCPRLLVSENTPATLRNVEEAPFTSVNASDTVATTSFGGFESAGTTLTVTPHIAEGPHLSLDYDFTFSSFAGAATEATVPPPRTTNTFSGQVQVPDGFTVIIGGLEVENLSDTVSEVPLLGRIPGVGALFQNSSVSRTKSRIFAFIRPTILRDDEFCDLRYLTSKPLEDAEVEGDFPADSTMWMK